MAPPTSTPPARDPAIQRFLSELVAAGAVSCTVGLVANARRVVGWGAAGARVPGGDPPDLDTRFDLASLTKPIVATLGHVLDRRGALGWETTLGGVFPQADRALRHRRLHSLLRHRAGLVAWTPVATYGVRAADEQLDALLTTTPALLGARPGTYSDLGYMLWARAAELATGAPLGALLAEHVLGPLAMNSVGASPGPALDVAACGLDNAVEVALARGQGRRLAESDVWRHGEVHDGNARALGGLAGHAGLFGSARDLWRFAAAWLAPRGPVDEGSRARALGGRGPFAAGWARRRVAGSAGPALAAAAYGHTGFVGHSLWIDPVRRLVTLWLAHRLRVDTAGYAAHRRAFHALAVSRG